MKSYLEKKEEIRDEAIKWQADFCNHYYSWAELFEYQEYFQKMGKKYGLLEEFEENGIC